MQERYWGKTYMVDEEMLKIQPLLKAAVEYQQTVKGFLIPYSYWTDKQGKLYIKWNMNDREADKHVCRYWFDGVGELVNETIPIKLSKQELLRGKDGNSPVVLITGDTHRNFNRIKFFCEKYRTTVDDILIILGDAGINYYLDDKDRFLKKNLAKLPITFFCVRGNHEERPENVGTYKEVGWHGGLVYREEEYPNLIFAKDGEVYDIAGKKTIVIGGAYSVDKWYRLQNNYKWFKDELLSEKELIRIEERLEEMDWNVDVVLSHTLPYQYRPLDMFMKTGKDLCVNESMEQWFREVEMILSYEKWYAGHFHCDRRIDKLQIMFRNVELFCKDMDLNFSME